MQRCRSVISDLARTEEKQEPPIGFITLGSANRQEGHQSKVRILWRVKRAERREVSSPDSFLVLPSESPKRGRYPYSR